MRQRILVHPSFRDRVPAEWSAWEGPGGVLIAKSATTESRRIELSGLDLFVKRHRYPLGIAIRASLRNTLVRPSRAVREFRMLQHFRQLAGDESAPRPVVVGERRSLGLLRESFLATVWVEGAIPLCDLPSPDPEDYRRLGNFLSTVHAAGLSHGRLFARNVLLGADGGYRLVDLDRARAGSGPAPVADRARDLAFLDESLRGLPAHRRLRTLHAYVKRWGSKRSLRRWMAEMERFRPEARERLDRR